MAWVRIHDGAMHHPKILGLSDRAFRVWVAGLSYCQSHLTDGVIPGVAAQILGVNSKVESELCAAFLWSLDGSNWRVHDYLDWNDSRGAIQSKRAGLKDRVTRYRERYKQVEKHTPTSGVGKSSDLKKIQDREEEKPSPLDASLTDTAVTERAGRFIERYEELYVKHRKGARYVVKPHRDWTPAVDLCRTWTDDERLDKIAAIFLTTDNEFAEKGSRTIGQFAAMASWCDGKLAEWESKQ